MFCLDLDRQCKRKGVDFLNFKSCLVAEKNYDEKSTNGNILTSLINVVNDL